MYETHQRLPRKYVNIPCNEGLPHCFTIGITEQGPDVTFNIKKIDKNGDVATTGLYQLNRTQHASYLDMFEKLHADFGLRLPQNRRPSAKPTTNLNYLELLSYNLDKGMRYGYGDPAVLRVAEHDKSFYYVVSTSNDAPDSFPIIKSANLIDWEFVGYVFPKGNKPGWAADGEQLSDYWAPEMHKVGNEYRVYFAARDKKTLELCIGLAKSASPKGPFVPEIEPVLKGNVIDPHIYIEDEKTTYLFWKADNNDVWPGALVSLLAGQPSLIASLFPDTDDQATASFIITLNPWLQTLQPMERFLLTQVFIEAVTTRFTAIYNLLHDLAVGGAEKAEQMGVVTTFMKTPMFARQLTPDGKHLVGHTTHILENDLEWEAHLIEGMWVTHYRNKYYLFYAGNDFSTDRYGIGVAIGDSPLGPYHKLNAPILTSTEKWLAPGHPSVTIAPDGTPVMVLHAFYPGKAGYKQFRALLAVPLHLSDHSVTVSTASWFPSLSAGK